MEVLTKNSMKKIISMFSIAMLFALSFVVAPSANAATDWDVSGSYDVEFQLLGDPTPYVHDMFLTQDLSDDVTGNGGYLANNPPYSHTWTVTDGSVSGDTIDLTIDYILGAPGTTMHMEGEIDTDGSMGGTWSDNYGGGERNGTWTTTAGHADNDGDDDGVLNGADICSGTEADGNWDVSWGTNRLQVQDDGDFNWYQNKPVKKGKGTSPVLVHGIDYTYGCNGHQILTILNDVFGNVMNGHLKYGLSSGLVDEFHNDLADHVVNGKYYLETVTVPAVSDVPVSGAINLLDGHNYAFKASGTANAGDGIEFDADYSYRTPSSVTWTDSVSTYEYLTDQLLDLKVNGGFVNWDNDAVYNPSHIYWYETAGLNAPASFQVYDTYYPGNTGSLIVDIYATI